MLSSDDGAPASGPHWAPQPPDVCWRAQWGTYSGGVYDSEFEVDRDLPGIAGDFLSVDLDAMAREAGEPCWASLEGFRTAYADGRPCTGDDWDVELDTELAAFRASRCAYAFPCAAP